MTIESITRSLGDHMLYMDLLTLFFGLLALKALDKRLMLLVLHTVVGIFVVLLSKYTASLGNNLYFSYIYAPYEVIIFSAILYPPAKHKVWRQIVQASILAIITINLLEGLLIENGFTKYNSYTYTLINLLIGTLAIRQLLLIRFDSDIQNLSEAPIFWVSTSLAIKHISLITVWAFFRIIQDAAPELLWNLTLIREIIIYFCLTLWITAFWKARKSHQST